MKTIWALILASALMAQGATYYVDYDGGSDAAAGTSTGAAWKHCRGDANATGTAASATFAAGDTVLFKGGVIYRGMILLPFGGSAGNPVTYRGDGWGTSKAIIDGSEPITFWTPCESQSTALGNTNWANIFYATVTAETFMTNQRAMALNVFQDSTPMELAQYPRSTNQWYQSPWSYRVAQSATTYTLTDPNLVDYGVTNWTGMYCLTYCVSGGRELYVRSITNYNATTKTLGLKYSSPMSGGTSTLPYSYAIANCISNSVFNRAGNYYYDEAATRLYVWPFNNANPTAATNTFTYSSRPYGIHCNQKNYVVVQGFIFQKQTGDDTKDGTFGVEGCSVKKNASDAETGVVVRDNEMRWQMALADANNVSFDLCSSFVCYSNYLHDTRGRGRGIGVGYCGSAVITNNTLINVARTGISLNEVTNAVINGNRLEQYNGVHANGISVYEYSPGARVIGNYLIGGHYGITVQDSGNVTVVNNVINHQGYSEDGTYMCFGAWGGSWGSHYVLNNTFVNSPSHYAFSWDAGNDPANTKYTVENNIFDGGQVFNQSTNCRTNKNNLFLGLSGDQVGYVYGSGEFLNTNAAAVFVNSASDFRLNNLSPAIDTGLALTSLGYAYDIVGTPRGTLWDIGAYENIFIPVTNPPPSGKVRGKGKTRGNVTIR